ncbi:MAG: hypothetical protein HY927_06125 [Elusimicrobia bacterium]|nr:hypothetical protein [Elusimicrobiota bacterium]
MDTRQPFMGLGQRPQNGRASPWRPRTPSEIAEFTSLWMDPSLTTEDVAKRFHVTPRTAQKWKSALKLPAKPWTPKDLASQAETVASSASEIVTQMAGAASAMEQTVKAAVETGLRVTEMRRREQAMAEGKLIVTEGGTLVDPKDAALWNPLKDPEVSALLDEIGNEARTVADHAALVHAHRLFVRLAMLLVRKAPVQTWEGLGVTAFGMMKALGGTRRIEAELPPAPADPFKLREDAGREMFREWKSVMNKDELEQMGRLIHVAADRLRKMRKPCGDQGAAGPGAPGS